MFQVPHELWLVALSIAIAIQGSFVGLSLAARLETTVGARRRLTLAGSALTLATGVWAMHFVGMLAANFPSAVDYLALPTLLSFLICVLVVGCGVYAAHASRDPPLRISAGAVAMGLGICVMHYVGVSAIHLAGPIYQARPFVAASLVVSIAASGFALWLVGARPDRARLLLGATALGLAISGMHYTAMAGMRLDPICFEPSRFVEASGALSRNALALLATVIAFGVSGAFLLSLVPDGLQPARFEPGLAFAGAAAVLPSQLEAAPRPQTIAPAPATLWVEKDGRPRELPVARICAVRANAHYTYVCDGETEYFCNRSISALEASLDREAFMRVHRSHIVRLSAVQALRRAGDAAVLDVGAPVHCTIPVARAQLRDVKQRLQTHLKGAEPPFGELRQQG
jgi:NO-binding membrane sensor protein with MHYT domain